MLSYLPLVEGFAHGVFEAAVRWTVPFLLVLAVTRSSRLSAAIRHHLWVLLLAGLVLLPVAQSVVPVVRVERPATLRALQSAGSDLPLPATGRQATAPPQIVPAAVERPQPASGVLPPGQNHAVSEGQAVATPGGIRPMQIVLGLWATVALLLLSVWGMGHLLVHRLCRTARPAPAAQRRLLRECSGRLGIRSPVRLLVAAREAVPMTCGWLRRTILLPESSGAWSEARLRRVLLHELAHVARADPLTHNLARAACSLFWFHPGVWFALGSMRAEAELACDDRVVETDGSPIEYAEDLLGIARSIRPFPLAAAALPMAQPGGLERRIRSILETRHRGGVSRGRAVLFASAMLALLSGVAAFQWSDRRADTGEGRDWLMGSSLADGREVWTLDCGTGEDPVCRNGTRRALAMLEQTGRTGAAVVQRVSTGEIVVYAALRPAGSGREAAVPLSEPGSVAKLAVAALWWSEGMEGAVPCPRVTTLGSGRSIRNAGDLDRGSISADEMLVTSCNTAAARMAETLLTRVGVDGVRGALDQAGFGSVSAAGAPSADDRFWTPGASERDGWAAPPKPYLRAGGDAAEPAALVLAGLGIGGSATTPLHISRFLQAVGNGGRMIAPRPPSETRAPAVTTRLWPEAVAARLQQAMRRTVSEGTAARTVPQLEWSRWSLGGKTGTVPRKDGALDGWFAGLAHDPSGEPEYTIVVLVEGGGVGGHVPAGIAAEMTRFFARTQGDEL